MRRLTTVVMAVAGLVGVVVGCGPDEPLCPGPDCPFDTGTATRQPADVDTGPTCGGCVDREDGSCRAGDSVKACGTDGEYCSPCGIGEYCNGRGECVTKPCGPESCSGCCRGGECRLGTKNFACGAGGEVCSNCEGDEQCTPEGECVSCQRGCRGPKGRCLDGNADEACGAAGEACIECGDAEECKRGRCIESNDEPCAQSCVGCCRDGKCLRGASRDACGSNGSTCQSCPEGFDCSTSGRCIVGPDSRWDVMALGATIVQSTVSGDPTSGPDPYLEVTVGEDSGKTSAQDNKFRVEWNEATVTRAKASAIKSDLSYILWDEDLRNDDKIVAGCTPSLSDDDFTKSEISHTCIGGESAGSRAEVRLRLVPK